MLPESHYFFYYASPLLWYVSNCPRYVSCSSSLTVICLSGLLEPHCSHRGTTARRSRTTPGQYLRLGPAAWATLERQRSLWRAHDGCVWGPSRSRGPDASPVRSRNKQHQLLYTEIHFCLFWNWEKIEGLFTLPCRLSEGGKSILAPSYKDQDTFQRVSP